MVLFLTCIISLSVSVTHSNFIMQAFKIVLIPLSMGQKMSNNGCSWKNFYLVIEKYIFKANKELIAIFLAETKMSNCVKQFL